MKLKHDTLLSNCAFNFTPRPSNQAQAKFIYDRRQQNREKFILLHTAVGRCRFTPGWKQLTPRLLASIETKL